MNDAEPSYVEVANGTVSEIDGRERVYYDGYWIRYYRPPRETLTAKKNLIKSLTRRTFHHTEPGINTPGENIELARSGFKYADCDAEKRVNAAMLAGALFNRATDIFTTVVELEGKGVHISYENELLNECSECLEEAMKLGRQVRHSSGREGLDELWGEPLKAFTLSIADFYKTRYIKISLSMRDIDRIAFDLNRSLVPSGVFDEVKPLVENYSTYAKWSCEIMRKDPDNFFIWPKFVATSDGLREISREICTQHETSRDFPVIQECCRLVDSGRQLISYISRARVPMPKSTDRYLKRCKKFRDKTKGCERSN